MLLIHPKCGVEAKNGHWKGSSAPHISSAREKPTDPIHPVWGHSETYAWLGIAYMDRDEENSARAAFEKALEIDPNNGWVKYELLPKVSE